MEMKFGEFNQIADNKGLWAAMFEQVTGEKSMEIEKFNLEDAEKEQRVRQLLSLGWSKVKCEYCEGMGGVFFNTPLPQRVKCNQCNGLGNFFIPPPATVRDAMAEIMDKPVVDLEREWERLAWKLNTRPIEEWKPLILEAFKRVRGE